MRKLILLLILSSLFSCKKEAAIEPVTNCYDCEIIRDVMSNEGFASEAKKTNKTYCNRTAEQIIEIENAGTGSRRETVYTETFTVIYTTKCKIN